MQACAPRLEVDPVDSRGWEEQSRHAADPHMSLNFRCQAVTTYNRGFADNSVSGGDVNGDGYGGWFFSPPTKSFWQTACGRETTTLDI